MYHWVTDQAWNCNEIFLSNLTSSFMQNQLQKSNFHLWVQKGWKLPCCEFRHCARTGFLQNDAAVTAVVSRFRCPHRPGRISMWLKRGRKPSTTWRNQDIWRYLYKGCHVMFKFNAGWWKAHNNSQSQMVCSGSLIRCCKLLQGKLLLMKEKVSTLTRDEGPWWTNQTSASAQGDRFGWWASLERSCHVVNSKIGSNS